MTEEGSGNGPFGLVASRVRGHLSAPGVDGARRRMEGVVPEGQAGNVDAVLGSRSVSYRDVLIVQLAYKLAEGAADLTTRHSGARTVGQKLGRFFANHHIRNVQDAYQNIGKNTTNLVRGNFVAFDAFLQWATTGEGATEECVEAVFDYCCAAVAATARPVSEMPALDRAALTFAGVSGLLRALFEAGSQGAYEQFAIAALLSALIEQTGSGEYRVETKNLNASDKSSRAAGDVQVMTGNRVVEAYEVTANDWEGKLPGAEKTVRDYDLTRIHIVASVEAGAVEGLLAKLAEEPVDVSVLSLWGFATTLTSALTRSFRAEALHRLYEYLDRYQPDIERVNEYVGMIESRGLNEG